MMNNGKITIDLPCDLTNLRAGDIVRLSGEILTARDAAHRRLCALMDSGDPLPVGIRGRIIYYTGPCPPRNGHVIGACGPTTSGRMDAYTPRLLRMGMMGMIGKGPRSRAVVEVMKTCGAVYFAATGGVGALLASKVIATRTVAFDDLGTEAIRELTVRDLPLIIAIDTQGGDLYQSGPARWAL